MPISFNAIPVGILTPGQYIEFDNTKALSGLPALPHVILVMGQRLTAGTVAAQTPVRVLNPSQAREFFGRGSMLAHMFEAFKQANETMETWAVALDDNGAGATATGKVDLIGTATAAGTLNVYIGGRQVQAAVAVGDTDTVAAAALAAAITADADLPVTAVVNGVDDTIVDLTARHKGESGNDIDVRLNYFDGEALPAGLTSAVVAMAGGTANPDVDDVIAAIGDEQYRTIVNPWTDAPNLTKLETELTARFGPLKMIEGHAYSAARNTHAGLGTLGDSRNSRHLTIMGYDGAPGSPWEWAASVAGVASFYGNIDPARPFQTLALPGLLPPKDPDRFTRAERDLLLNDGISTFIVDAGGVVRVERLITTENLDTQGIQDRSYLDVNTLLTLYFLRYSLRARIAQRFPRHKLASDGNNFGAGQAIVTPKIIRAEILALFRDWEAAGLVEDVDQFKDDLIVEINGTDPNRVDALIPPNLVNQLRVFAGKIEFRL